MTVSRLFFFICIIFVAGTADGANLIEDGATGSSFTGVAGTSRLDDVFLT